MALNPVLVSCGCCAKLRQTWSFKTTEICPFTVLEARRLKSLSPVKVQVAAGCTSSTSRGSRGGCVLPLLVAHGCWHSSSCGHITPVYRVNISESLPAPSSHHLQLCVSARECVCVCVIVPFVSLLGRHL